MIDPRIGNDSTPVADKSSVSTKTPKHCNKSVMEKTGPETFSRLHGDHFLAGDMENRIFYANQLQSGYKHIDDFAPCYAGVNPMALKLAQDHKSNFPYGLCDRLNPETVTLISRADQENSQHIHQQDYGFRRAVSSSFGEMNKIDYDKLSARENRCSSRNVSLDSSSDHGSMKSDGHSDLSWKALHQVASVDEENFNRQFTRHLVSSPPLNNDGNGADGSPFGSLNLSSSSLSNSTTTTFVQSFPTPSKLILLNSLSTIASSQKPLEMSVNNDFNERNSNDDFDHSNLGLSNRKRSPVENLDPPHKKSKVMTQSFSNDQGPPRFTLSVDSMNSFQNEMYNVPHFSSRQYQPNLRLQSTEDIDSTIQCNSSWDLNDRLGGSFTFETCDSFGDSSVINRAETALTKKGPSLNKPDVLPNPDRNVLWRATDTESRNQSFDDYLNQRISDDVRDDYTNNSMGNGYSSQKFAPSFNQDQLTNYGGFIKDNGRNQVQSTWPSSVPQLYTSLQGYNDYRPSWPHSGYMYPQIYGSHIDYWRNSNHPTYGMIPYDVIQRQHVNKHLSHPTFIKWSPEDDVRLANIMKVKKFVESDFETVATELGGGKSAKDCQERWLRCLKPGARKGHWQDHEDALILETVLSSSEQPFTKWSELALRLPGRVGKQIRDRWVNHLNPNIKHNQFTPEEDLLLWDGHKKYGNKWVEISVKVFHSSRSENHIKNRFYSSTFKRFVMNTFGHDAYVEREQDDNRSSSNDLDGASIYEGEASVAV